MPFGAGELVIILLIVVVVFGSTKLPMLGDGLGRAIKNFKRAVSPPEKIESNEEAGADDASTEDPDKGPNKGPKSKS